MDNSGLLGSGHVDDGIRRTRLASGPTSGHLIPPNRLWSLTWSRDQREDGQGRFGYELALAHGSQMVAGGCTFFPLDRTDSDMSLDCVPQAWIPGRFDDIDIVLRTRSSGAARARGDYIAVSDGGGERAQRGS